MPQCKVKRQYIARRSPCAGEKATPGFSKPLDKARHTTAHSCPRGQATRCRGKQQFLEIGCAKGHKCAIQKWADPPMPALGHRRHAGRGGVGHGLGGTAGVRRAPGPGLRKSRLGAEGRVPVSRRVRRHLCGGAVPAEGQARYRRLSYCAAGLQCASFSAQGAGEKTSRVCRGQRGPCRDRARQCPR